jgi:hypothetical protein
MVEQFRYALLRENQTTLTVTHGLNARDQATLDVNPMRLIRAQGRKWDAKPPETFYRFSDITLSRYQNADALAILPLEFERLMDGLVYLGPLREPAHRIDHWSGDTVPNVGPRGEYAIAAILAATAAGRKLSRGNNQRAQRFDTFIAAQLKELGVIRSFAVRPIAKGRNDYEVLVRTSAGCPEINLTDAGFGVSHVLPAVVQAFYAPPHSTVWLDQPEAHLHPRAQAELADAFIGAVQAHENGKPRNVQIVVESHSEHFLLRLQRRVAEGLLNPDDVAILFVHDGKKGAQIEEIRIDAFGELDNWPDGLFGDDLGEIATRAKAAMRRKIARAEN